MDECASRPFVTRLKNRLSEAYGIEWRSEICFLSTLFTFAEHHFCALGQYRLDPDRICQMAGPRTGKLESINVGTLYVLEGRKPFKDHADLALELVKSSEFHAEGGPSSYLDPWLMLRRFPPQTDR